MSALVLISTNHSRWLPKLAKLPEKFIYEPWKAPTATQKAAGVLVGSDYPRPMVDHSVVSKENMSKMQRAYDRHKKNVAKDDEEGPPKKKSKAMKQSKLKF